MAPPKNIQHMDLNHAIKYFGPLVNDVANKYGISGTALLAKLVQGESGGRADAVSNKGARGLTQFMPGVRDSFLKAYGVDAYRSPGEAVYAATLHLRGKLGHGVGLEGYNPGGGQQYVNYILGQKVGNLKETSGQPAKTSVPTATGSQTSTIPLSGRTTTTTTKQQVPDEAAQRRVALADYLLSRNPNNRLVSMGIIDPNEPTTRTVTSKSVSPSALSEPGRMTGGSDSRVSSSGQEGDTVTFEGKQVAPWIAPALRYARKRGWRGTVSSGYRSYAEQKSIYDSGVRPAAKPGTSNHEGTQFPRGAIDVSDANQLDMILKNSPYADKLVYAGPQDPVHFSHPHNGSY